MSQHNSEKKLQCISSPIISYINVDSRQRTIESSNIYDNLMYTLPLYPLEFTNGKSIVKITLPDHPFNTDDRIALSNVISKNVVLHNVLSVKKNSMFVKINHHDHGLSLYGLYDETEPNEFKKINYVDDLPLNFDENDIIEDSTNYYILKDNAKIDLMLQLSNIKGSDMTRTMIGNIPVNYLNRKQRVYLLFVRNGNNFETDPNNYLLMLEKKANINYRDGEVIPGKNISSNIINIRYNNLFGIPLNYLNSGTPVNENSKYQYATIVNTTQNTFDIDVGYNAIVDPFRSFYNHNDNIDPDTDITELINSARGGGNQILIRRVDETIPGYPNPNFYAYPLSRNYNNVVQVRIIGSCFPNSQRTINDKENDINNNNLYWRNLDDGEHIYKLSITPGNYSPNELARSIEEGFRNTLRRVYSEAQETISCNSSMYDENGNNKYHIVDVSISDTTDIVTFSAYREILQHDNGRFNHVLTIPDNIIEFTLGDDMRSDLGTKGVGILPFEFSPFLPDKEIMYIYFTQNSHIRINNMFPYAYRNLYKYNTHTSINKGGLNNFLTELETSRSLLVNFHRTKGIYPHTESQQEINSINTATFLDNFTYNHLTNEVHLPNHKLKKGDLIITDQFNDPMGLNQIFVYEIIGITDVHTFTVVRYIHGTKYKFIYDSLIINFSFTSNDMVYWLDDITPQEPVIPLPEKFGVHNNTKSIIDVKPGLENKRIVWVHHSNHQLNHGDEIMISLSNSINNIPSETINKQHIINKILDHNYYEILLDKYTPINTPNIQPNTVLIRYPDFFQMFFNYDDTLGGILGFEKTGDESAITPYKHVIKNTDPYMNDYESDPTKKIGPKKLDMTGFNYFYLCSPELGNYYGTKPVSNVFSVIRWTSEPGTVVFDSFTPAPRVFNPPLRSLSELHFSMVQPNGHLVDFNGLDHQFTIEIIEEHNEIVN